MQPWMIVISSAIGAVLVAAALAAHEVQNTLPSDIPLVLLTHVPALVVAAVAVYALCAMLLTTATLILGILRLRLHLSGTGPDRVPLSRNWITTFGAQGFRQLAPRLAPLLTRPARADSGAALQSRPNLTETRGEIARLHYILLARCHFFSALIVLAGVVGLGVAQEHGPLPFASGAIPTSSAILILVGLGLIAVLGRIAVDVTAEPVLELMSRLPAAPTEIALLRRAVELLEVAANLPSGHDERVPASPQLPEQIVAVVEQGHHALLDAIGRLSANTQALGAVVQSSADTLETAIRSTAAQPHPAHDHTPADVSAFPELQTAIEELTAVLQRLSAVPEDTDETSDAGGDPAARRRTHPSRLARELQKLLREIEGPR